MNKYILLEENNVFSIYEKMEFTTDFPNTFVSKTDAESMIKTLEMKEELTKVVHEVFGDCKCNDCYDCYTRSRNNK
jgi:hypothetical protein